MNSEMAQGLRREGRFPPQSGIAIGPILFIIAVLAILAAAIAAGSGSFTGGTSAERGKLMAATLLQQATALDDAVNLVRGNGYSDAQISFYVPTGLFMNGNADWGQNSAAVNGSYHVPTGCSTQSNPDTCSVYKPGGGSMTPQIFPQDAMDLNVSWCPLHSPGCRAPLTMLAQMEAEGGAAAPIHLAQIYAPILLSVCRALNNLVGVQNPGGAPPHVSVTSPASTGDFDGNFFNSNNYNFGEDLLFPSSATFSLNKDFCFSTDYGPWTPPSGTVYIYVHVFR